MVEKYKKIFVVDASFVIAYLLEETTYVNKYFEQFIRGEIKFIAPGILWYEVGNGLKTGILRKRITQAQANGLYESFVKFGIDEKSIAFDDLFLFALSKKITFYDASYSYLAKKTSVTLLTLDKKLQKNFD